MDYYLSLNYHPSHTINNILKYYETSYIFNSIFFLLSCNDDDKVNHDYVLELSSDINQRFSEIGEERYCILVLLLPLT